jgi:hypothetical protein
MGRLKKGCLIAAAVVAGIVFIFLWVVAYFVGQDIGYTEGYDAGHTEGYDIGHTEGYDGGYTEGYDIGHTEGYDKGQLEGYEEGQVEGYSAGHVAAASEGGLLVNPSYQEMKQFLEADRTDTKQYIKDEYDHFNMTADIKKNAEAQGIRTARVYIEFPDSCLSLVAFETTDKGLIFICPDDDKEMRVEVGIKYYEDNGYQKPDWDDTIKEVVISW